MVNIIFFDIPMVRFYNMSIFRSYLLNFEFLDDDYNCDYG